MGDASYDWTPPVARFAPVLKELADARVLRRGDDGSWVLSDEAQAELAGRLRIDAPASAPFAVGIACTACGSAGLSSIVGGRRLCMKCRRSESPADAAAC